MGKGYIPTKVSYIFTNRAELIIWFTDKGSVKNLLEETFASITQNKPPDSINQDINFKTEPPHTSAGFTSPVILTFVESNLIITPSSPQRGFPSFPKSEDYL